MFQSKKNRSPPKETDSLSKKNCKGTQKNGADWENDNRSYGVIPLLLIRIDIRIENISIEILNFEYNSPKNI